jgi:NADPH:quinone reductase
VYSPGNPQGHALSDGPDLLEQLAAGRTHGKLALDPYR